MIIEVQAETAYHIESGGIQTTHPGYSGTGYLNITNLPNTYAAFYVTFPVNTVVLMDVRYANGDTVPRPIRVFVNDAFGGDVPGLPTGAWPNWATERVSVPLKAGRNDIRLSSVNPEGMPNIDKFDIIW